MDGENFIDKISNPVFGMVLENGDSEMEHLVSGELCSNQFQANISNSYLDMQVETTMCTSLTDKFPSSADLIRNDLHLEASVKEHDLYFPHTLDKDHSRLMFDFSSSEFSNDVSSDPTSSLECSLWKFDHHEEDIERLVEENIPKIPCNEPDCLEIQCEEYEVASIQNSCIVNEGVDCSGAAESQFEVKFGQNEETERTAETYHSDDRSFDVENRLDDFHPISYPFISQEESGISAFLPTDAPTVWDLNVLSKASQNQGESYGQVSKDGDSLHVENPDSKESTNKNFVEKDAWFERTNMEKSADELKSLGYDLLREKKNGLEQVVGEVSEENDIHPPVAHGYACKPLSLSLGSLNITGSVNSSTKIMNANGLQLSENPGVDVTGDCVADNVISHCEIDEIKRNIKKEVLLTFDKESTAGQDIWIDPNPYGLKQCFCSHGFISFEAGHFHCQECGNSYQYRISTLRHEVVQHRVKHPNVKILKCEQCSRIFVHSSQFKRHLLTHRRRLEGGSSSEVRKLSEFEMRKSEFCRSDTPRISKTPVNVNLKVAFEFRKRSSRKHKSDEVYGDDEDESFVLTEKTDRAAGTKYSKTNVQKELESEKELPEMHYNITKIEEDGQKRFAHGRSYNGPLLSTLLRPTHSCSICNKKLSKFCIQIRHYAQVHRIYLNGISLYLCSPCGFRSISNYDFDSHIRTERHQNLLIGKKKSDCMEKDSDSEHKLLLKDVDISVSVAMPRSKKPPSSGSSKNLPDTSLKTSGNHHYIRHELLFNSRTKNRLRDGSSPSIVNSEAKTEISKSYAASKVHSFYSTSKNESKVMSSCMNIRKNVLAREHLLNACAVGHVCTNSCLRSLELEGKNSSARDSKRRKMSDVNAERVSQSDLFQPLIVDSFSCLPYTWSDVGCKKELDEKKSDVCNSSQIFVDKAELDDCKPPSPSVTSVSDKVLPEEDEQLSVQAAFVTSKAIRFYQESRRTFLASALRQPVNPSAVNKINASKNKLRPQVALKSLSCKANSTQKNSIETCNEFSSFDHNGSIFIRSSDDESESAHSLSLQNESSRVNRLGTRTKHTNSSSSHVISDRVSISSSMDSRDDIISDVIALDDSDILVNSQSKNEPTLKMSSNLKTLNLTLFDKMKPLTQFSTDVLFGEMEKRRFMKLCVCGVYFRDESVYNLHSAWHSTGSPMTCSVCGINCKDWHEFYSHILSHSK